MSWLGPGLVSAGTPPALGYSIHAFLRAADRWFAVTGLALSVVETVAVLLVLGLSAI